MIVYRDAQPGDDAALSDMARRSFTQTFGTLYDPDDLSTFLERTFGPAGLPGQIGDPSYSIRLATAADRIVGFAKIGPNVLPIDAPGAIELYQLYVLDAWQGAGVGPRLMDWAIEQARDRGAPAMTLSVFVDNHRAKRFYARRGFRDVGRYDFPVGNHVDEDRLMLLQW